MTLTLHLDGTLWDGEVEIPHVSILEYIDAIIGLAMTNAPEHPQVVDACALKLVDHIRDDNPETAKLWHSVIQGAKSKKS